MNSFDVLVIKGFTVDILYKDNLQNTKVFFNLFLFSFQHFYFIQNFCLLINFSYRDFKFSNFYFAFTFFHVLFLDHILIYFPFILLNSFKFFLKGLLA